MNNLTKFIIIAALACLFAFIVLTTVKEFKKPKETSGYLVTKTKVDTFQIQSVSVPKLQSIDTPQFKTSIDFNINISDSIVLRNIIIKLVKENDSIKRLLDTKKTFSDVLCLDSAGIKISITDSVYQNSIINRQWDALYTKKTIVQQKANKRYLISPGIYLINERLGLSVNADILVKNHLFGLSLGTDFKGKPLMAVKYSLFPF